MGISNTFKISEQNPDTDTKSVKELVYNTELSILIEDEYIFTKIITISPRYILVNELDLDMLIVQSDCYAIPEELPSHGRKPFHWVDASKPMLLAIRLIQQHADKAVMSGSMWDWTSSFPIDELGTFTLRNANLFQSRIAFVKVSRKFHQGAVFVIFHHENLMHPLYRIENHSRHVALKYAQEGQNDCCEYLDCQAQVPFAWPVQAKPHLLNVRISLFCFSFWEFGG